MLAVPTVPVSDFAMYRESANYLSEFGSLDPGFIYMPGFVVLLAWVKDAGGGLLAQKLLGVFFGGLGTAGLFALAYKLMDDAPGAEADEAPGWRRLCPCPHAVASALAFALWPAGLAVASVVGTDMPAAALLAFALGLLVTLGPRRPYAAAIAFGAAMGLCAWVRAVALPLSLLAFGYWLARRQRLGRAVALTAVGVATTLLVLLPWGIRHVRGSGALYFTDDHGGITALIGANPNSEGTYTRALNRMFKDVTGRSVLDEPHRETDRAAYAIAREWFRFEPGYALGLATLKADRLFDPEHRLLYWSIFRPGVLVGRPAAWFAARRGAITRFADGFGLAVAGLALAGLAAAVARRRWGLLALVPFQGALVATYAVFFAEPRYRLPIEMLALPFVALALGEIARTRARGAGAIGARVGPRGEGPRSGAGARRRLAGGVAGGARCRHRPARAASLGGDRGRAGRAHPPLAVGAGAAARRAVAAGGITRRRPRARRRRRPADPAAAAAGRRPAPGRPLRDTLPSGSPDRGTLFAGRDGGRDRGRRARRIRRRNQPPGWTVDAVRCN